MKTHIFAFLLLLTIPLSNLAQLEVNSDSLYTIYKNKALTTETRLEALHAFSTNIAFINPDSSLVLFNLVLNDAREINSQILEAKALMSISNYYSKKGNFVKELAYKQQSLELFVEEQDTNNIIIVYINIGAVYNILGKNKFAIKNYEKAISLISQKKPLNKIYLSNCYNNIGLICEQEKQYVNSYIYHSKAIQLRRALNRKRNLAVSYNNMGFLFYSIYKDSTIELPELIKIGVINHKKELLDSSENYQVKAHKIFDEQNNQIDKIYTDLGLGLIKLEQRSFIQAINHLESAYDVANQKVVAFAEIRASKALSECYCKYKKPKLALFWLEKHMNLKENENAHNKKIEIGILISEMEYSIETEKLKHQYNLENEKKESQKKFLFTLSLILLISILFVIMYYKSTLKLKKQRSRSTGALEGIEQERKRLALELHDAVGSKLSLLKSKHTNDTELVDSVITTIRNISHKMLPIVTQSLGFNHAIESLLEETQKNTGLYTSSEIDPAANLILSEQQKNHLYRIMQELIQNTIKHSGAQSLRVLLSCTDNKIVINYQDNGKGITTINEDKLSLLYTIKERLRIINGSIKNKEAEIGYSIEIIIK